MHVDDSTLIRLSKMSPELVPLTKVDRCLSLLDGDEEATSDLVRSLTKRRPRNDRERRLLLSYALRYKIGGVLFVDYLGGFTEQAVH